MSGYNKSDPKGAMIPGSHAAPKHLIHTVSQLGKPGSQWSFGKRPATSYGKGDTPGPDRYSIASTIGSGPSYVVSQRLPDHSEKSRRENPGPAAYHTNDASKVRVSTPPSYSLSGRGHTSKPNEYPGPDRYRPQTAPGSSGCSLSGRHKEPAKLMTPGPGAYQPAKESTLPTAASYSLRSRTSKGSGYKGSRCKGSASAQGSPGPAAYKIGDAFPHKKRNPAFSMGARLRDFKCEDTPSPDAYYIRSPLGQKKSW